MTTISSLPDLHYARILKTYFSWNTEDEYIHYWNSFVKKKGFSQENPPIDSESLRSEFEEFLQKYKSLGITPQALKLTNSLPSNPYYNALFSTYFQTFSENEREDIWNEFLVSQGYTENPPDTYSTRNSLEAFIKIVKTPSLSQILNDSLGEKSERFRTRIWSRFAASQGLSNLVPADTAETQAAFLQFVKRYNAIGINEEALSRDDEIPIVTSNLYHNYLNGFFGNLSAVEQKDIWNTFLHTYGYNSPFSDTPQAQKDFVQFINSISKKISLFENATNLSLYEMKSRIIVNEVLGTLKKFLNSTQTLIQTQSATLMFYGKMQQIYTEMMTRVPNLTGGAQPTVKANSTNVENFTFGYNDISLQDVIRWGIHQSISSDSKWSFGNTSPQTTPNGYQYLTGQYSFQKRVLEDGTTTLRIWIQEDSSSTNTFKDISIMDSQASPPIYLSFDEMVSKVSDGFLSLFQQNPGFISAIHGKGGIPGRYLGIVNPSGDDQIKENTNQLQMRAEVNASLQQIVENVRSRREVIQNLSKQLQSNLNQMRDGLDQQTNLWTSILESIDSIMQEINKR